jgi:hypothetical protein
MRHSVRGGREGWFCGEPWFKAIVQAVDTQPGKIAWWNDGTLKQHQPPVSFKPETMNTAHERETIFSCDVEL